MTRSPSCPFERKRSCRITKTPGGFHIDDYGTAIGDEQVVRDVFPLFPFHVSLQQEGLGHDAKDRRFKGGEQ